MWISVLSDTDLVRRINVCLILRPLVHPIDGQPPRGGDRIEVCRVLWSICRVLRLCDLFDYVQL